jgi:hypothetical protein
MLSVPVEAKGGRSVSCTAAAVCQSGPFEVKVRLPVAASRLRSVIASAMLGPSGSGSGTTLSRTSGIAGLRLSATQ